MLWALVPWFMVCAWLVRAAGPSVLQCGLSDCLGVCAEGFNGPRLVPQAFKLKSFHDLYLLSKCAAWDIYTSFANFEETGTNRPAILSLIPVLGGKDKPILAPHLTSASKKHHRRQIPLLLPKINLPIKHHWHECTQQLLQLSALFRQHTAITMTCIRTHIKIQFCEICMLLDTYTANTEK